MRRATALQQLDDLEHALADAQRVRDVSNAVQHAGRAVLERQYRLSRTIQAPQQESWSVAGTAAACEVLCVYWHCARLAIFTEDTLKARQYLPGYVCVVLYAV